MNSIEDVPIVVGPSNRVNCVTQIERPVAHAPGHTSGDATGCAGRRLAVQREGVLQHIGRSEGLHLEAARKRSEVRTSLSR